MSRVLVTGGAGRLGRSVVAVLAEAGHEVISVDRHLVDGLPAQQHVIDLLDASATEALLQDTAPDAVIHLAAISVPFSRPDAEIYAINTGLAFTMLEACLATGVGKLLVASSPTVIGYGAPGGWTPQTLPITEEHPVAPWNGYAASKVAVEGLVAMAVRRNGAQIRVGAFRPCYVIAPEEWGGAPTQQGHTVRDRLADPSLSSVALFNYVDARDAGRFVLAWLEKADDIPNGSVFFVGAADSMVRTAVGPALAAAYPAAAGLTGALPATAPVFSSELARTLLGWEPIHTWRTELGEPTEQGA